LESFPIQMKDDLFIHEFEITINFFYTDTVYECNAPRFINNQKIPIID